MPATWGLRTGAVNGGLVSSIFIASDLAAAFLAGFFVVFAGAEGFEDSFALHFLLKPS